MKRVKLLSTSKKLPLKCWYSLPDSKKLSTVLDLKRQLVTDLSLPCKVDEFMLEMDEYELLKSSKIDGVLRDNDILSIRLVGKKRKASIVVEEKEAPVLKKKKTAHTEKTRDKPKKVVKATKPKTTDKKDTSKKNDKKASKKADKKKAELKKKEEKKELKKKQKEEKKEKKERELKKKKKKEEEEAKNKAKKKTVTKGKPVEVKKLSKTQQRNLRRKILKQKCRESKENSEQQEDGDKQQEELVDLTVEEQEYEPIVEEQANGNEMADYNPYGRALVTSIECAPNFKQKKKNRNRNFTPREYPVHKVPQLFYAQHDLESYFESPTSDDPQFHIQDGYMQNGDSQEVHEKELNNNKDEEEGGKDGDDNTAEEDELESEESEESEEESESEESDEEEEEDGKQDEEEEEEEEVEVVEEEQATTKQVDIDYDTLVVLNFHDNPPHPNDRLAIKILELTSTYTPEISDWKHVSIKQIDAQAQTVLVEFEKGFGKASTKGGKFDIRKKKKRNNWHRGRRYYEEEEEEEQTNEQDKEEETTATILMTNIFEMRKLN